MEKSATETPPSKLLRSAPSLARHPTGHFTRIKSRGRWRPLLTQKAIFHAWLLIEEQSWTELNTDSLDRSLDHSLSSLGERGLGEGLKRGRGRQLSSSSARRDLGEKGEGGDRRVAAGGKRVAK
jgi:hypothetical protein